MRERGAYLRPALLRFAVSLVLLDCEYVLVQVQRTSLKDKISPSERRID
jgi:hypothetical protein